MHKCIFQGRLGFRNESSFKKAFAQYEQRLETYYKFEVAFDTETMFVPEELSVVIPRTVDIYSNKFWKNSVDILEYLSQFALSGSLDAWKVESGVILEYFHIEPLGDKAVIQAYQKGLTFADEKGSEEKAIAALTKAIEKFDKHSQAYERRGFINYKLGNDKDAMYDYTKSILIDPKNSQALYGRAMLYIKEKNWKGAIKDLEIAAKNLIALQGLFWRARRIKGECHVQLEEWDAAAKEFKFFLAKKFDPQDTNYKFIDSVRNQYLDALAKTNKDRDAIDFLGKQMINAPDLNDKLRGSLLVRRATIRHKLGLSGFRKDLNEAISLGNKDAKKVLSSL